MQHQTMIAGISGTHGTGKSTIMDALIRAQQSVDRSQISRAAQAALGWATLKDATETVESTIEFQEAVLNAMYDRDIKLLEAGINTTVFVERTPADVFSYAKWWIIREHECTNENVLAWLEGYKRRCRAMQSQYLTTVIVRPCAQIPFVPDPNRASLMNREFVRDEIENFIVAGGSNHTFINTLSPDDRAAEAITAVTLANMKGNYGKATTNP